MGADTLPDGDALGSEQRAQPREKNGRFATNAAGSGLTIGCRSGNLQSSPKVIGKNGGVLKAEDLPSIKGADGKELHAKSGTKVTKIHSFAGKGANATLKKEPELLKIGGKKGEWQHTTGDIKIEMGNSTKTAEVHWFQEPSVGIIGARVKRWRK